MLLNRTEYDNLHKKLQSLKFSKAFIHSDLTFGFKFAKELSRNEQLQWHFNTLKEVIDKRPIRMPAFNYDFPATKKFNVQEDPSQVGVLTEYFRTNVACWRSTTPIFSFTGDDDEPVLDINGNIDPFGKKSMFQQIIDDDTLIMLYGTIGIAPLTIIHYCERVSEKLFYRYDKTFSGQVILKDKTCDVDLIYHVRPKNHLLEYDYNRLENDLLQEGLLYKISGNRFVTRLIKASDIARFWIQKMQEDPLYLLNAETRAWVEPELEKLGRPFLISDFE